uniref:Uncharacterized protein n=1 Tax=viral metagenome TaxID=1070528 RepID=A0A6M3LF98_9ZZZZ
MNKYHNEYMEALKAQREGKICPFDEKPCKIYIDWELCKKCKRNLEELAALIP